MDDMQRLSSPKSKMASSIEMHVLHFGNKLNEEVAADLSLQIFLIH